jgi:hypothetical protein
MQVKGARSMNDEVLATVRVSQARRWLGIGMLGFVGLLVIYVALSNPPSFGWQVFLLAMGALGLWMAEKMRRATEGWIELTETVLRDQDGQVLAKVADIKSLERGVFAFKPSNGFLVTTKTSAPRQWKPGLWWRLGRRIGIGGVTPGAQTKFMSEILAAMIATRDHDAHTT